MRNVKCVLTGLVAQAMAVGLVSCSESETSYPVQPLHMSSTPVAASTNSVASAPAESAPASIGAVLSPVPPTTLPPIAEPSILDDSACYSVSSSSFDSLYVGHRLVAGTPCKKARDKEACAKEIQRSLRDWSGDALITKGDKVTFVSPQEALRGLLPINSPDEAGVAVSLQVGGISSICEEGFKKTKEGYVLVLSEGNCGGGLRYVVESNGEVSLVEDQQRCRGRRPEGLCDVASPLAYQDLGAFFARAAWEEAASVPAFRLLARDLARFMAPSELIAKAERAAIDEIAHAQQMTLLARQYGDEPTAPIVDETSHESLFSLAVENRREGCINEMFAALVAQYQAATAADPQIAEAMRVIAADEAEHASLAWEIDEWLSSQLSQPERAALEELQSEALRALQRGVITLPAALSSHAGWPSVEVHRELLSGFSDALRRERSRDEVLSS